MNKEIKHKYGIIIKCSWYTNFVNYNGDWDYKKSSFVRTFHTIEEVFSLVDNQSYSDMHTEPFSPESFFNPMLLKWQSFDKLTSEIETKINNYMNILHKTKKLCTSAINSSSKTHSYLIRTLKLDPTMYWNDFKRRYLSTYFCKGIKRTKLNIDMNDWLVYLFTDLDDTSENYKELKLKYNRLFKVAKFQNSKSTRIGRSQTIREKYEEELESNDIPF